MKYNLERLNKNLKKYSSLYSYKYIDLSFIDIKDKRYKINSNKYCNKTYTLYEYCILLQKYKYIK